jgi:iron(III) transport system permease protein
MGAFLAWVVGRTNTPLARFIGMFTLGRIIIPGILITVSWIFLASPSIGILNYLIERLTGVNRLLNIYSFPGMVWVVSLELTPLAYLLLSASLQSMDPRLEEASTMTGAGTWRTLRRISLPLITPAIGASLLLLFVLTIEAFEVPLLLGGRARVPVYTTEVYLNAARTPTDWGLASTYSVVLIALAMVLLFSYFRLLRQGEKYQTITGKDYRPRRIDLGPWRYVTCAVSLIIVLLTTGAPLVVMLYASFLDRMQPPTLEAFRSMTLENYHEILGADARTISAMWNSTLVGLGTATVVMLVVSVISYYVHKTRFRARKALDFLSFVPIAIPGVVLGTAVMWLYLIVPLPVIGTLTIIGLAYLTKFLPFSLRFVSASMIQIHNELEEAAAVAGVPWWKNFYRIYLPLLRPGLMAGWFWVMVHAYRELTISLMLARSQNRTASVIIFDLWENASFMGLSAFGVLMFMVLIVLVYVSHKISQRYGIQEQL